MLQEVVGFETLVLGRCRAKGCSQREMRVPGGWGTATQCPQPNPSARLEGQGIGCLFAPGQLHSSGWRSLEPECSPGVQPEHPHCGTGILTSLFSPHRLGPPARC